MHATTESRPPASAAPAKDELEMLAFRLGGEEYGIDIQAVQELRGYDAVTRVANAPACLMGIVNLRGVIVPIVDMRIKFKLAAPTYDQFTVVIIVNVAQRVVGMVVDSVSDVITLNADQVKPAPRVGPGADADHLVGIGTPGQRMLILLDLGKLLSGTDTDLIGKLAA